MGGEIWWDLQTFCFLALCRKDLFDSGKCCIGWIGETYIGGEAAEVAHSLLDQTPQERQSHPQMATQKNSSKK